MNNECESIKECISVKAEIQVRNQCFSVYLCCDYKVSNYLDFFIRV